MADSTDEPMHGRREGDLDRRRWNDDRLDDLAHTVRALGPIATQVARHDAVIDQIVDKLDGFEKNLGDFIGEYRNDRDRTKRDRGAIVVAAIAAAGGILVALISAAAILLTGGPG